MSIRYSIVVPAYKERGNLEPLTRRVFAALQQDGFDTRQVELVLVDDNSCDGSVEVVEGLCGEGYNVCIYVRTKERGLSSAVLYGLNISSGDMKLVMDADLQHPPEAVPAMFRALESGDNEFVCGTRYGAGVEVDKNWPVHRRIISWGARLLARPLSSLSDPMSGFFGIRSGPYQRGLKDVNPIGYKIALELFVKCHIRAFKEVSFNFATRTCGESKLTGKVILYYLQHLHALYYYTFGPMFYVVLMCIAFFALYVLCFIFGVILN